MAPSEWPTGRGRFRSIESPVLLNLSAHPTHIQQDYEESDDVRQFAIQARDT